MSIDWPRKLHERLPARPESIPPLRHMVLGFADDGGASDRQREDIALAVTEALSNAVLHAYVGDDSPGLMAVNAQLRGERLEVVVCDEGVGMTPRADSPGMGLGLPLIQRVTEQVELEMLDSVPGVRVRMTFQIG